MIVFEVPSAMASASAARAEGPLSCELGSEIRNEDGRAAVKGL
jgi:hypothetical protein